MERLSEESMFCVQTWMFETENSHHHHLEVFIGISGDFYWNPLGIKISYSAIP